MLLINRRPDGDSDPRRLDVMMGTLLLAAAWAFAAWFGYTLLDPKADMQLRLTALALAAVYHLGAYGLAARGRSRWAA